MPLDRIWQECRLLGQFLRVVLAEVALTVWCSVEGEDVVTGLQFRDSDEADLHVSDGGRDVWFQVSHLPPTSSLFDAGHDMGEILCKLCSPLWIYAHIAVVFLPRHGGVSRHGAI